MMMTMLLRVCGLQLQEDRKGSEADGRGGGGLCIGK